VDKSTVFACGEQAHRGWRVARDGYYGRPLRPAAARRCWRVAESRCGRQAPGRRSTCPSRRWRRCEPHPLTMEDSARTAPASDSHACSHVVQTTRTNPATTSTANSHDCCHQGVLPGGDTSRTLAPRWPPPQAQSHRSVGPLGRGRWTSRSRVLGRRLWTVDHHSARQGPGAGPDGAPRVRSAAGARSLEPGAGHVRRIPRRRARRGDTAPGRRAGPPVGHGGAGAAGRRG
jgi:hypothetical protein